MRSSFLLSRENERGLFYHTCSQNIPSVPLLPEGKDIRGLATFFPPLLWGCLSVEPLSFGTTTVYTLAVLFHNLQQYLRDVGDPISTLKVVRIAHEDPRKCSAGVISTLTCFRWNNVRSLLSEVPTSLRRFYLVAGGTGHRQAYHT